MKRSLQDKDADERVRHLCACAKAFLDAKRGIPGNIVTELLRLKKHWGGHDIPADVASDAKRFLAILGEKSA